MSSLNLKNIQTINIGPPFFVTAVPNRIHAGFPSPAEDLGTSRIDLNKNLICNQEATFIVNVCGYSMKDAGINDGDQLLIDRAIIPKHGHIVVANINNEFTIKKLFKQNNVIKLQAANSAYSDIFVQGLSELKVWGVATWILRRLKK